MEVHPAADIFPTMTPEEYAKLLADIDENGLLEPVVIHARSGKLLDGRHRWRACRALGIEPQTVEWDGEDPETFVISKNLHRRHLKESQRAMIAARIASRPLGSNQYDEVDAPIGAPSQREVAKTFKVGRRAVQRARAILNSGRPELIRAVDDGKLAVAAAVKQLADEKRAQIREMDRQSREDIRQLAETMTPAQLEAFDSENLRQKGAFARLMADTLALGDPAEFARKHAGTMDPTALANASRVREWLGSFIEEAKL